MFHFHDSEKSKLYIMFHISSNIHMSSPVKHVYIHESERNTYCHFIHAQKHGARWQGAKAKSEPFF